MTPLKTWNKLQILEACTQVIDILRAEEFDEAYVQAMQCGLDDLVMVLDGQLVLPPEFKARETLLVPGFGFVPVVGQVVTDTAHGNRVEWYRDDDDDDDDEPGFPWGVFCPFEHYGDPERHERPPGCPDPNQCRQCQVLFDDDGPEAALPEVAG